MATLLTPAPPRATPSRGRARRRAAGLVLALAALVLAVLASLAVGSRSIPVPTVVHDLLAGGTSTDAVVVRTLRVPRTALGLAVGAALGLAGAVLQAVTRNPLADPGLLGVQAGASAAIVTAIGVLGVTSPAGYVWFALAGAAVASVVVYLLGATGRASASPVRLVLAGAAVSATLGAWISGLALADPQTFDSFRFWAVGALAGRPLGVLGDVAPFLAVGGVLALALGRSLNAVALGDDTGRALGAHLGRTRTAAVLAVTLLAGAATAAVGPIAFLGLAVPHLARAVTGPDQRWVLPYSAVLAPVLLLGADVLGRVVARPGELEAGIVTAFLGAPVLIVLARRTRTVRL